MITSSLRDLWYKNAIWYGIDVKAYQDSDGDGTGDFIGLTQRLSYLAGLGVTAIWLMPFYPSPNTDNGYDVADYYGIDPSLGTLGDFVEFLRQAEELGIRVIVDLVVSHTSDQHPWFQEARRDPISRYRDFYVWSDELPTDANCTIVFPGEQDSNWTRDDRAGAWYRHIFYPSEPDLNIANPEVVAEIFKIMGFWLALGVSGFRVDAAPFLIEHSEILRYNVQDPHAFLRDLKFFLTTRRGDAVLLAEANVLPDQLSSYFGDGNEMNLLLNFVLNNYVWLALARQRAEPIATGLRTLPEIPPMCQWANFLHTYDELDLSRLSSAEEAEVMDAFAPEPDMRIYGRGIRRRVGPMLGGDASRITLAQSLISTLPGAPLMIYGDEIGMGDDLTQPGRFSTRTPMQWTNERNAGFSTAATDRLIRPVVSDGPYGFRQVNVQTERRDGESALNRTNAMIRTRKESPEFGWGALEILATGDEAVFAHICEWRGRTAFAVHNLADTARTVHLDLGDRSYDDLQETLSDGGYDAPQGRPLEVALNGYGYRWFRLDRVRRDAL